VEYTKPPLSVDDQITTLEKRGLIIEDKDKARHYLSQISFYRLRGYTYPFQDNDDPEHPFTKEVTLGQIMSLYNFDRKLRLLVFNALGKIEVAIRTKLIYHWSMQYGGSWWEKPELFRSYNKFQKDKEKLANELDQSSETFIDHYYNKYTEPYDPPAWITLETASFGLLSKIFENLKKSEEKKNVAKEFGLPTPELLESWLHSFVHLRNFCAHHARIWNRRLTVGPQLPTNPLYQFIGLNDVFNNKLYASLSCIVYVLNIISPNHSFVNQFHYLLQTHPIVQPREMGFTENWGDETIWKLKENQI
jgi:abortive infection bacteriophage resistance protein